MKPVNLLCHNTLIILYNKWNSRDIIELIKIIGGTRNRNNPRVTSDNNGMESIIKRRWNGISYSENCYLIGNEASKIGEINQSGINRSISVAIVASEEHYY